jgi:hypothetical protein
VRDALTLFGFSGKDAGDGLFIDVFFGCLCEAAGELLITDGLGRDQKRQERVDLLRRQGIDDLMKSVQVAHDLLRPKRALRIQYIEWDADYAACVSISTAETSSTIT